MTKGNLLSAPLHHTTRINLWMYISSDGGTVFPSASLSVPPDSLMGKQSVLTAPQTLPDSVVAEAK